MSGTPEILFEYLRSVFYGAPQAELDIEKLDKDYVKFAKGLVYFVQCFVQYNELANALARGNLSLPLPPPENELAAPLKSLHASLKHLTWQSQQVAKGDYKQRVDFMGEFADAFNMMIEQLAERQKKLENEIELSRKHAKYLEQSTRLLSSITQYIPQQLFVIDTDNNELLLINDMANIELEKDADYFKKLMELLPDYKDKSGSQNVEIFYNHGDRERYLSVSSYFIGWNKINAEAFVINDVSIEKNKLKNFESHAYCDSMTKLYNRFYGMLTLNDWLNEKRRFALVFIDLDNLKYINDNYGHHDGDRYIIHAATYLKSFFPDALVCRIGGDEFMLLIPEVSYDGVYNRMNDIQNAIQKDEFLQDKDYYYSLSFGIVAVEEDSELASSIVLQTADERMYEHKRARKKNRQEYTRP